MLRNTVDLAPHVWRQISEFFLEIWRFQVATVDGNGITIANITIALLVFAFCMTVARRLSRLLVTKILARAELSANSQALLEALAFYLLVVIFLLFSLDIAQIPLKVFAVVGGALAIGVGFGSQTLIKDFISGIVLMIEQPARVGDVIQVDAETTGRIIRIGAISTHVQTIRGADILIPNSQLVEKTVVNWTLESEYVRRFIRIGAAYGSDTRLVERLLADVADEYAVIAREPAARAYFTDFGDSALMFELHYWVNMSEDLMALAGSLRHRIAEAFTENGIVIALPQRDMHLFTPEPLRIQAVGAARKKK